MNNRKYASTKNYDNEKVQGDNNMLSVLSFHILNNFTKKLIQMVDNSIVSIIIYILY